MALLALGLLSVSCGGKGATASAESGVRVHPLSEVQSGPVTFEAGTSRPGQVLAHVRTKQDLICAFVWGESPALGRFNNAMSMNGTGISDHIVALPGAEAGRTYHYIVEGAAADGTLYRSTMATFTAPAAAPTQPGPSGINAARQATVTAVSSEFSAGYAAGLAIDGDLATEWSSRGDGDRASMTLDLGAPTRITALEFITRSMADGTAITHTYQVVVDGTRTYGPFPAGSPTDRATATVDFTGRVLRFSVVSSSGGNTGASEIRAFTPAP